jgi:dTDP-4-amino-4,6-dideoxygalactose transaminase
MKAIKTLAGRSNCQPSWHIFPILLQLNYLQVDRAQIFSALRAENIGINVHYIPVYWHPVYRDRGYLPGLCPVAETAYHSLITLPLFAGMDEQDVEDVITAVARVIGYYSI